MIGLVAFANVSRRFLIVSGLSSLLPLVLERSIILSYIFPMSQSKKRTNSVSQTFFIVLFHISIVP